MTTTCRICGAPERGGNVAWFGYYRFRCMNGHRSKIATPKRAAKNWKRLTTSAREHITKEHPA